MTALDGKSPGRAEIIARAFHEAYETLAPEFGYRTREASARPWDEVPEQNRALMTATVERLLERGTIRDAELAGMIAGPEAAQLREERDAARALVDEHARASEQYRERIGELEAALAAASGDRDARAVENGRHRARIGELTDERDKAYRERAALVAFLTACYPSVWDVPADDPDGGGWPVVYVTTPLGQMSWHIAPADKDLLPHVPPGDGNWDGHTAGEKYERLADLTGRLAAAGGIPGAVAAGMTAAASVIAGRARAGLAGDR